MVSVHADRCDPFAAANQAIPATTGIVIRASSLRVRFTLFGQFVAILPQEAVVNVLTLAVSLDSCQRYNDMIISL